MILLQVKDLWKTLGTRTIFRGATAAFREGVTVGCIGRNGAGKSTLCRILTGESEPDDGEVVRHPDLRLGYLEQSDPFDLSETVREFLGRHTGRPEWECARMAARFELGEDLLDARIEELSGGYRTRVKLSGLLLEEPNFLVLDEPTNFLDLHTLILLERFLEDFTGGALIVSHDREFLLRTCEATLEVARGELITHPGDVEDYLEYREAERARRVEHNRQIDARIERLQEFVDRNRVQARTASQAQAKLTQIERLEEEKVDLADDLPDVHIRIPPVEERTGPAVRVDDLRIGYEDHVVASAITLDVQRGERIAVVGQNGHGKTTFLRTVAGEIPALGGEVKWSRSLDVGTYAQHVFEVLHPRRTVREHLVECAPKGTGRQPVLDLAGAFLFQGKEVDKRIEVLSGGERARLALAGLLLEGNDAFVLDEPTNHLDFETVEALADALADFGGTLLFTSHDRTFVGRVATSIFEVHDGDVIRFPGDYGDYVRKLRRRGGRGRADDDGGDEEDGPGADKLAWERKKEIRSEVRALEREMAEAEERMDRWAEEKEAIERSFVERPTGDDVEERSRKLQEAKEKLAEAEERWLALSEEIEALREASPF